MIVKRNIDIEADIKSALEDHLTTYVRPLPPKYKFPNILVHKTGGTDLDTIDTFTVVIDSRSKEDEEANEYLRNAIAILKVVAKNQTTNIRAVKVISSGSWGNDPVRQDVKLCSATLQIVAHEETVNI